MNPHYAARREARLLRFRQPWQELARALTCCNGCLEDLAESFPGLLFALVSGYGTECRRRRCSELVMEGASLRQAAKALGLPYWLRKLPASAFTQPLGVLFDKREFGSDEKGFGSDKKGFGPDERDFGRKMASLIPAALSDREAAIWLHRVLAAHRACHERFALWVARHKSAALGAAFARRFFLVAAWAWYSGRPDEYAHRLIARRWHPRIGFRPALNEAEIWRQRIDLAACLGEKGREPWFERGEARGYEFVPLGTIEDFLAESAAMKNCLDQYARELSDGLSHVISIRKDGVRLADLEIAPDDDSYGLPEIKQLRGPRNVQVHPEIWKATRDWLFARTFLPHPALRDDAREPDDGRDDGPDDGIVVRTKIWRPYLDAVAGMTEVPLAATIMSGGRFGGSARRLYALPRPKIDGDIPLDRLCKTESLGKTECEPDPAAGGSPGRRRAVARRRLRRVCLGGTDGWESAPGATLEDILRAALGRMRD